MVGADLLKIAKMLKITPYNLEIAGSSLEAPFGINL